MKLQTKKTFILIGQLAPLAKRHPWIIAAMVFLGIFEALSEGIGISLFIPFLYSLDLQGFQPEADDWLGKTMNELFGSIPVSERMLFITVTIFGLIVLKGLLSYANGVLYAWFDMRLSHYLCCRVVDQILTVGMRFIERSKLGKLLNILESTTYQTSEAVATLVNIVIALATITIFTALLVLISWQLTALVLFALVVISIFVKWLTRRVKALARAGLLADHAFSQHALELLNGTRTIRLFGREAHEKKRFSAVLQRVNRINFVLDRITGVIEPVSEILAAAVLLALLFFTLQNPNYLPAVLVFVLILYRLQPQLAGLDEDRTELAAAAAPIRTLLGFLERRDKPYIRSGTAAFDGLKESIRFDSVSFSYETEDGVAVQALSFNIPKDKTTAIVGPSGAGKSTSIDLLARLYEPDSGTIYVDGVPLNQLDINTWRARLAIVNQNASLFDTTIKDNIAYGRLGASDDDIVMAAKRAAAHEFICTLPAGYDTRVGSQGVRLSSGQQQRIAIARALVRNPDVLILDEATNALDSLSENVIQESLMNFKERRTMIVIAHRLSTIELADQILVLDAGRLIEQGSTRQLLENRALFAKLYHAQNWRLTPSGESS